MGKSWSLSGARVGMESDEPADELEEQPRLKIAVLGDFSGRGSQRNAKPRGSGAIRALAIDRDNFEQVLQHLNVRLDDVPVQPSGELGSVAIDSLDDFHPDSLLQRVATFRALRDLRSRLAQRETFAGAMEEARGLLELPPAAPAETKPAQSASQDGGSLLEQMLDSSEAAPSPRALNQIERYAQAVMAPYSIPADDPRQESWIQAADQAAAFAVTQLLHDERFRSLEARWRALDWLVRRIDSDVDVKVALIDISEQELRADLDLENLAESVLYELLVTRPQQKPGDNGWQVLVVDPLLGCSQADVELIGRLSQIAADSQAQLLIGLTDQGAGCSRSDDPFVPGEFEAPPGAWAALQSLPDAAQTSALWPGFLLRQPYGKQTNPVESLEVEELTGLDPQTALLWGNSAYLGAAQRMRAKAGDASLDYTGLPCVVLPDGAGKKQMVPVTGWWLRELQLAALLTRGVTAVVALPHAGALRVFPLKSVGSG